MIRPHARRLTLALALAGLAGLVPSRAAAEYRYLCTSVPTACEYTGPDAPKLAVDVCHGPGTGVTLMGSECPVGTSPYAISHGELLDPITNAVAVYMPLDDACDHIECVEGPSPGDNPQPYPICCDDYVCFNLQDEGCYGTLYFCHDGVCNDDGTVTCFESNPLPNSTPPP